MAQGFAFDTTYRTWHNGSQLVVVCGGVGRRGSLVREVVGGGCWWGRSWRGSSVGAVVGGSCWWGRSWEGVVGGGGGDRGGGGDGSGGGEWGDSGDGGGAELSCQVK